MNLEKQSEVVHSDTCGVQEINERYFIASDGSRHARYADAYKATVKHKLVKMIANGRLDSLLPDRVADKILQNFTVSLPRI